MMISAVLDILDQRATRIRKVSVVDPEQACATSTQDRYYVSVTGDAQRGRIENTPEIDAARHSLVKFDPVCIVTIQRGYEEFRRTLEKAMMPPPPPGLDVIE